MMGSVTSLTATRPVEAPGNRRLTTQPVEAPGARSEVHSQSTGTGSVDVSAMDRSLTSKRTVAATNTGVSDSEDDLNSEPESPAADSDEGNLSNRDPPKDDELDQEFSEEANYKLQTSQTMRGVHSFMGWHQIPDIDSLSSSQDNNTFAGSRAQPTRKVSIKLPADDWLCKKA